MRRTVGFILLCIFSIHLSAQQLTTESGVVEAISLFRSDPLGEVGYSAGQNLLKFATESDLVFIELSVEKMPWIENKEIPEEIGHLMLIAYLVGNIDAQIKNGGKFDSHCPGVKEVSELLNKIKNVITIELLISAESSVKEASLVGRCKV